MSSIYLQVTIKKNGRSQNFNFPNSKNASPGQFLGPLTQPGIIEF